MICLPMSLNVRSHSIECLQRGSLTRRYHSRAVQPITVWLVFSLPGLTRVTTPLKP